MNKPLCSAADTSLFVDTDGKVGLCCAGKYLGDLKKESLFEIFEKEEFKSVQRDLANGKFPDYCITCENHEKQAPGASYMHHLNDHYPSSGFRQLQHVDIRWSNICNLTCRYCDPLASSQWMKVFNMPIESPKRNYNEELLEEIRRNKDTIRGISLLGGEPFLQKPNEKLFEIINKSTKIDIVTNLSVDLENNKIYRLLKDFPNVTFSISFENVGDKFEYVRAGASWERLVHNINVLKRDNHKYVGCLAVYNIWSATDLRDLYEFCERYEMPITWQLANYRWDHPDATDGIIVAGHNKQIIERCLEEIDYVGSRFRLMQDHATRKGVLDNIKNWLSNAKNEPRKSLEFLWWTERSEELVKPQKTFRELWPDLYQKLSQN